MRLFGNRDLQRASTDFDEALSKMKLTAAAFAKEIASLFPNGHRVTAEQIDKAAADFGKGLLANAEDGLRADGCSEETISMIGPLMRDAFVAEFKASLRAAVPLHHLAIEGSA